MSAITTIFYGSLVNPISLTSYQALPSALLAVTASGNIAWLVEDVGSSMVQTILAERGILHDVDIVELKCGEFIMPGFVDTHTHASQVPNIGSGQQYELLDWLDNVTFPTEARFADADFARTTYDSVVRRYINSGTTTCCYYATIHLQGTQILADVIHAQGQRAFVGKCNMDRNCPDYYREASAQQSLRETKDLISYIRSLNSELVRPILTPRFAITCTGPLLAGLGDMLKMDAELAIQTHISENQAEIAFTKSLFPNCESYTDVYDRYNLLTNRTILAHAVHMDERELDIIAARKTGISHCPTSNFNIRSGMAKIGEMLDRGIKVGLGTDVSGGFSLSILTAIQHASMCSKMVALGPDPVSSTWFAERQFSNKQLSVASLLYLATQGGADVCNLSHRIGSLEPGKAFDAIRVSVTPNHGSLAMWGSESDFHGIPTKIKLEAYLERFMFCGDDRNILDVYVQGKHVGGQLGRSSFH